jgi:Aspartyl protease
VTCVVRAWLLFLLLASAAAVPFGLVAQRLLQTQTAPSSLQSDAASLQQLLDRGDYITYSEAILHVDASQLTESQRQYFLGMLAFHLGKLDAAAPLLMKGVNINDRSLTSQQAESALETLGQINLKLTYFAASAKMYDDIDKAWGSRMGDDAQAIREKRQLAALFKAVPKQTIQLSGDFTLPRTGPEYPASISRQPTKQFSAQFDTGTEISVLSASTAKAWSVTMLAGTATLHGYGGGGFAAQPGFIPALTIGKAELHNVAVYVTADENLYIPQIKRQTNAPLGYSVVTALGRLTFTKDGSLTVSTQSPARDLETSAALWLSGHSLLVELGTQPIVSDGKFIVAAGRRLFMLDTGSGSTYLTDRYLAEHTNAFHGPPPETAILAGAGGVHEIPAYGARNVPLFAGQTVTCSMARTS